MQIFATKWISLYCMQCRFEVTVDLVKLSCVIICFFVAWPLFLIEQLLSQASSFCCIQLKHSLSAICIDCRWLSKPSQWKEIALPLFSCLLESRTHVTVRMNRMKEDAPNTTHIHQLSLRAGGSAGGKVCPEMWTHLTYK